MASSSSLPANVHVSTHPCLRAKLSQLRSKDANARETKSLIHEIALIVGCEALANSLQTTLTGTVSSSCTATPKTPSRAPIMTRSRILTMGDNQAKTPLGYTYSVETTTPHVVLVPILRSGLGMLEGRLCPLIRTRAGPITFLSAPNSTARTRSGPSSGSLPRTYHTSAR